ncbi:MAG: universal stress protein [Gammaproteobacteria bacterium]
MNIDSILVPIDLSRPELGRKSKDVALDLASLHDAKLHFLSVMPGFGMPVVASFFDESEAEKAVKRFAKAFRDYLTEEGLITHPHSIAVGKPHDEIIKTARKIQPDLILIHHAKRSGSGEFLLGSCSQQVTERAPCSVLVIKDN